VAVEQLMSSGSGSVAQHASCWVDLAEGHVSSGFFGFAFLRGRQPTQGWFEFGGYVHRSLRRRGQVLVAVGALLGALIGVALGLAAEDPQTSMAAAPGRAGGAALAVSPPSSQPQASQAASSGDQASGNDSAGGQRAGSADRPGKRHGNAAHKHGEGGRDKPGKGKDR